MRLPGSTSPSGRALKDGAGKKRKERELNLAVEQICRTRAKPQRIVATRLLYPLQDPVPFKSSARDSPPRFFKLQSADEPPEPFRPAGLAHHMWFTSRSS